MLKPELPLYSHEEVSPKSTREQGERTKQHQRHTHDMAPVDIVSWSESFEHLLKCQTGVLVFGEYLQTEYSEENLLFYLDCEAYRRLSSDTERTAAARRIYREFVRVEAPRQINIDCETRADISAALCGPGEDCFHRAQRLVYSLMENDSYPRFIKSDVYRALRDTPTEK